MSLEWIENSVPAIADVEDRHVENKHWVVHSPAAPEQFHACLSFSKQSPTIHFSSRVHSFGFLVPFMLPRESKIVTTSFVGF
jgi:hypothetical protein